MKTNLIIIFLIFLVCFTSANISFARQITLQECYSLSKCNYPTAANLAIIDKSSALNIKNIEIEKFPVLFLGGVLSGQSDATPRTDRDKYQLNLNIDINLYDGGAANIKKKIAQNSAEIERLNIKIGLYNLREKINKLYFEILFATEQIKILNANLSNLKSKLSTIESGVKNGVRLKSDALIIRSEITSTDSNITDYKSLIKTNIGLLAVLTGIDISESDELLLPEITLETINENSQITRYEYRLFTATADKTRILDEYELAKNKPILSAFSQIGYGKPALNMFDNVFESYAIAGFRLNWKIYDWQSAKNNILANELHRQTINNERAEFDKTLIQSKIKLLNEIDNFKNQILKDNELIQLRESILESINSQFNNGVLTATEYITNSNALLKARLLLKLHQIQELYYKIEYLTLIGGEL